MDDRIHAARKVYVCTIRVLLNAISVQHIYTYGLEMHPLFHVQVYCYVELLFEHLFIDYYT